MALTLASFLNNSKGNVELYYIEPEKYYEGALISATYNLIKNSSSEKEAIKELKALATEIHEHGVAAGESKIHRFPPFPIAKITHKEYEILTIMRNRELLNPK